jgi:amidase
LGLRGVKTLAPGLDTLGYFARDVDDLAWFGSALCDRLPATLPDWSDVAPRIGLVRIPDWSQAQPATVNTIESAAARLASMGAPVNELAPPALFADLVEAHKMIMHVEATRSLSPERETHDDQLSSELREILRRAAAVPEQDYVNATTMAREGRARIDELFAGNDVLLAASAPGEAPLGLEFTGDPVFNGIWTLLQLPCVTVPFGKGPNGLPVGVQIIGRPGDDTRLLSAARWMVVRLEIQGFD